MSIGREFGGLSWEDVSELRKAMSKSYGEEFFGRYREQFIKGATSNAGISAEEADVVWKNMVTFGSWGFNKSHAVGYGIISYWCAYLKAHHPLEFAKGALNNSRTTDDAIRILRDLDREYVPFDPERSEDKWIIQDGQLIGPLTALHGIGAKKAQDIMRRRREGEELTPGQLKLMADPVTPFHDLYPAHTLWGDYYDHPEKYLNQGYTFTQIDDIQEGNGEPGTVTFFGKQEPIDKYVFIGKLVDRNLRDHNEYGSVVKRGYEMKGQTLFLNLTLEDDSGSIICTIQRNKYLEYGAEIAEGGRIGEDWYLVSGYTMRDWRRIYVNKIRRLSGESQA
jgi:DNA polymerase III alpha subunit